MRRRNDGAGVSPQEEFGDVCFHALGIIDQNREYLQMHLLASADLPTRQALSDIQIESARLDRTIRNAITLYQLENEELSELQPLDLCSLLEKADWAALGAKLDAVRSRVLQTAALTVSLHGSEDALEKLRTLLPESRFAAARRTPAQPYTQPLTPPVNEAFIIDGGVNYDVLAWPMPRDSRRRVLARVMSYEYLWHTIREVGGAYGTGMLCADGIEFLYTYRDPHLRESYETFANAPAALAARDYTARDLDEFIVGTAAKLDTPRKARAAARELDHRYFCGITDEMRAADRRALCSVDTALLKAQAAALSDVLSGGVRVAFGSKDAVEAAKDLFDRVETL